MYKLWMFFFIFTCSTVALHAQSGDLYASNYTYKLTSDRMSCIENEVPLVFNEKVMGFIDYFAVKNKKYTNNIIRKKELYFPIFEQKLKEYSLPDELKYLSVIESGLRPQAVSRARAVGLWQFMYTTGKMYGLNRNLYVDDRMDPYQATEAAVRHLRDLYNIFHNWELALAAYNCGAGNVRKAIRKYNYYNRSREKLPYVFEENKSNGEYFSPFWAIYPYLPRETRSYVPQFVAVTYLFNYLEEHGFTQRPEFFFPELDTIHINQYFHLKTFCDQFNACVEDLQLWNSHIKKGTLPNTVKNFPLHIPSDWKDYVVKNRKMLYDTAAKVGKKEVERINKSMPGSTSGKHLVYHRVRKGDVLGKLAEKYHVRVSDIRRWNRLRSNLIKVGQRLKIWIHPKYLVQIKKSTIPKTISSNTDSNISSQNGLKIYHVRSGDSLWSISINHNTSIKEIKKANRLSSNSIKAGQQLVIPN